MLLATLVIWQSRADSRVHAHCAKCWKSSAGVDLHLIDGVQSAFFAVCCWSTRVSLAATCRRFRLEGRPRAHHPPTSEPQACRTCRVELAAAHFYVAADNRSGRRTHCMASSAAAKAWSLWILWRCCRPRSAWSASRSCRPQLSARTQGRVQVATALPQEQRRASSEQQKERLPSRLLPLPPSALCAACREEKPLQKALEIRCPASKYLQSPCLSTLQKLQCSPSVTVLPRRKASAGGHLRQLQAAMRQRRAARRPAATRQQASAQPDTRSRLPVRQVDGFASVIHSCLRTVEAAREGSVCFTHSFSAFPDDSCVNAVSCSGLPAGDRAVCLHNPT